MAIAWKSFTRLGEAERLHDALTRIVREAERPEQDAQDRVAWRGLDGRA